MDLAFFMVRSKEGMKVLDMKEKIKRKTVKSSEKSNGKEIEETVALTYKPLSLLLLLWLLYLLSLLVTGVFLGNM